MEKEIIMSNYSKLCKPTLSKALMSIGLDKEYFKASGNYLYYRDHEDKEIEVLDLLGGYGATLIGHYHPIIGASYKKYIEDKIPVHNQFSLRSGSGDLSVSINKYLKKETECSDDFLFCYTSTGAETMEIALKHAEYARSQELNEQHKKIKEQFDSLKKNMSLKLTSKQNEMLGLSGEESFKEIVQAIVYYNDEQFNKPPVIIALENAFHGKMVLTANCTHHPMYRQFLNRLKVTTYFLSPASINTLVSSKELQQTHCGMALYPEINDSDILLVPKEIRRVVAILAEPVQGEGGVWPLSFSTAEDLNTLRDIFHCPLIADEVQSGSGRCGALVASSKIGLDADYYALSKALGAGYVKIGALAIKKSKFAEGFDLIQSSTFGEDDLSCKIANDYINLLFNGDTPLISYVNNLSENVGQVFELLKSKYPDVIKDVRYSGLLFGIEFFDTENSQSYILRNIAYQGSLGYIIAGHLLNAYHIRVAPSGSSANVLRFEPSVYLEKKHITHLQNSLEKICLAIRYVDTAFLLGPIINKKFDELSEPYDYRLALPQFPEYDSPADFQVTFINHLISESGMKEVEPSFAIFTDEQISHFLSNANFNLSSVPFPPARIRSKNGKTVDFIIHPIPVTSQMISHALDRNNLEWLREEINRRIDYAIEKGSSSVGLGMFTSIVTNNGKSVKNNRIAVTTGNALTVGMGIAAVKSVVKKINLYDAKLSVVGAAGNIGSIYAEMLGLECHSLLLLGSNKKDSLSRLNKVKYNIYSQYYADFIIGKISAVNGLGARLALVFKKIASEILQTNPNENIGRLIDDYISKNYPSENYISVSQNIDDIIDSDIIICATNATNTIIPLKKLKENAIICDISVPHNIQKDDLFNRPDLIVLHGGVVKTPLDDGLDFRVRAYLAENQLYACMTETILIALEEYKNHYSYGNIKSFQVDEIMHLSDKHGFTLAEGKKEKSL